MRSPIRRRAPLVRASALSLALLAAACTDRNPAGLTGESPEPAAPPASALSELRCTAEVRAGTVECLPAGPETRPGMSAVIMGGHGTNVRLASSGTSYDGSAVFRTEVTVENLTSQALGTADGTTPAPEGVRVFFHAGPTVTGGDGSVTVANADGEALFTSAGQKFFRYDGILAPGDTTPAKEWRFTVPNTVLTFTFTVYVAAPVRSEAGWIGLSPLAPSLMVGDTQRIAAAVRTVTGHAAPAGETAVEWATTDSAVATVDAAGLVTAVDTGTATITATSGARTGSVIVRVAADDATHLPTVVGFEVLRRSVTAGVDSMSFRVAVRGAGSGVASVLIGTVAPSRFVGRSCVINLPPGGGQGDGVYGCSFPLPAGSESGAWPVDRVEVTGGAGLPRRVRTAHLLAAGAQAHVQVASPGEDFDGPTLDSLSFSPDTVAVGVDTLTVDVGASDAGVGIARAELTFGTLSPQQVACSTGVRVGGTSKAGVLRCRLVFPGYMSAGWAEVQRVRLWDLNGNVTELTIGDLQSAGIPSEVTVIPDTTPPVITGFSFSPSTVAGNGADSVNVTMSATDAQSGVLTMEAQLRQVGVATPQTRSCYFGAVRGEPSASLACRLGFGPADVGSWEVEWIRAVDEGGVLRSLNTAQMQAASYPTTLTVTP